MCKVVVKEYTETIKELDLEYPIFLSFQDDLGMYEYVKLFEKHQISVKWDYFGTKIEKTGNVNYTVHQILGNLITEEEFENSFEEALQHLVKLKSGL